MGYVLSWATFSTWPRTFWRRRARETESSLSPQMRMSNCASNVEALRLVALDPADEHWVLLRAVLQYLVPTNGEVEARARYWSRPQGQARTVYIHLQCMYQSFQFTSSFQRLIHIFPRRHHISHQRIQSAYNKTTNPAVHSGGRH